ncbi:hypothetical protein FGIG_04559 [Fasciola gigantica]|uniref:Uncharacterized protein n=1 Tax=Fasciola gigantica TaxID=46835 RepID=A0A504YYJ2_FASGI|nr:hypothetical protein FGIG_04559 [Fasciola gigantica]
MSSYIYVLAPFALGIILAICSSAYCVYIHFSKRRLVKRVRAQMLARIIYGSDTEVENAQFHADKQRKLSFLPLPNWRNAHVHGKFGNKQSNNLRGQREKSHPKTEEQQKQTIRGNVDGLRGESLLYLNMPGAPGISCTQFSGGSREQLNTQYLRDAKRNSQATQLPSNKNRPGEAQRIYENAGTRKYRQSNVSNYQYNKYVAPDARGSLSSLRQG